MTDQEEPTPKDPPVTVETPESRMTGEGGPPPDDHQEAAGHQVVEPSEEPDPQEPPD